LEGFLDRQPIHLAMMIPWEGRLESDIAEQLAATLAAEEELLLLLESLQKLFSHGGLQDVSCTIALMLREEIHLDQGIEMTRVKPDDAFHSDTALFLILYKNSDHSYTFLYSRG
jgi:hypothetical protein